MGSTNAWRYLWALPCSVVGVLALAPLALWGRGLRVRWRAGIVEAHLRRVRPLPFDAITLGHVVIAAVSPQAMRRLRAHEREAHRDNPFEVAARAVETQSWRLRASGGFFAK
jgi:hypothetical protein